MTKRLRQWLRRVFNGNRLWPAYVMALALTGCPQQYPDPLAAESGNDLCGTNQLARLISARAIELSEVCHPTPVAECHVDAAEAVRKKYEAKFSAWERCR